MTTANLVTLPQNGSDDNDHDYDASCKLPTLLDTSDTAPCTLYCFQERH